MPEADKAAVEAVIAELKAALTSEDVEAIKADIEAKILKKDVPAFRSGDMVRVHTKIKEGDKERIQVFEGVVIRDRRGQARAMFTVRKMSYGVGVERMFPVHSPCLDCIEVVGHGQVRRSLHHLRALQGKAARLHQG